MHKELFCGLPVFLLYMSVAVRELQSRIDLHRLVSASAGVSIVVTACCWCQRLSDVDLAFFLESQMLLFVFLLWPTSRGFSIPISTHASRMVELTLLCPYSVWGELGQDYFFQMLLPQFVASYGDCHLIYYRFWFSLSR